MSSCSCLEQELFKTHFSGFITAPFTAEEAPALRKRHMTPSSHCDGRARTSKAGPFDPKWKAPLLFALMFPLSRNRGTRLHYLHTQCEERREHTTTFTLVVGGGNDGRVCKQERTIESVGGGDVEKQVFCCTKYLPKLQSSGS